MLDHHPGPARKGDVVEDEADLHGPVTDDRSGWPASCCAAGTRGQDTRCSSHCSELSRWRSQVRRSERSVLHRARRGVELVPVGPEGRAGSGSARLPLRPRLACSIEPVAAPSGDDPRAVDRKLGSQLRWSGRSGPQLSGGSRAPRRLVVRVLDRPERVIRNAQDDIRAVVLSPARTATRTRSRGSVSGARASPCRSRRRDLLRPRAPGRVRSAR